MDRLNSLIEGAWGAVGATVEVLIGLGVIASILTLLVNIVRDARQRKRVRRVELVKEFAVALLEVAMHRRVGASGEELDKLSAILIFRVEMLISDYGRLERRRLEGFVRREARMLMFGDVDEDPGVMVSRVVPALLGGRMAKGLVS